MNIDREIQLGRHLGQLPVEHLQKLELFADVPGADLRAMADRSFWRLVRHGTIISISGTPGEHVFIVGHGDVGIVMSTFGARGFIGLLLNVGDLFDLADSRLRLAETTAAEVLGRQAVVYVLPRQDLNQMLGTYPSVTDTVEQQRARQLRDLNGLLQDFAESTARTRLAHLLARLGRRGHGTVELTHEVLGRMTRMDRADVTKALGGLKKRGLIEYVGRGPMQIRDIEGLASMGRTR